MTIKEQINNLKKYKEQLIAYKKRELIENYLDEQTNSRFIMTGGYNKGKKDVKVKVLTLNR